MQACRVIVLCEVLQSFDVSFPQNKTVEQTRNVTAKCGAEPKIIGKMVGTGPFELETRQLLRSGQGPIMPAQGLEQLDADEKAEAGESAGFWSRKGIVWKLI